MTNQETPKTLLRDLQEAYRTFPEREKQRLDREGRKYIEETILLLTEAASKQQDQFQGHIDDELIPMAQKFCEQNGIQCKIIKNQGFGTGSSITFSGWTAQS